MECLCMEYGIYNENEIISGSFVRVIKNDVIALLEGSIA